MAVGDALFYDPFTFRKYFKNIGRAYREQATTLIEICRLYAEASPQTYTEDDRLQKIFRLADAALTAAGKAKKGRTPQAADAFLCVQDEIIQFGSPPPRKDTPGDRRKKLPDPSAALASACKKDEKSIGILSKIKSVFPTPGPKGPINKVNFVILKSPHERHNDQLIIQQEIDNSTTTSEIIWRFSRYPEESGRRITARQNPHFYLELSKDVASYGGEFYKNSLKDFGHGLEKGGTIYVLIDKSCRLFLDAAKPRIFGNLWRPHQTVILKDVGGTLESEDIVLNKIGNLKKQDYWHRPSIADSSQRHVQSVYLGDDSEVVKRPVGNWRALVDAALRSRNIDLMVRDQSRPDPSVDSRWKPFPSPEPSIRVQEPEEQTTPRQSTPRLPQQTYSIPNTSAPSIGVSTLSPSTESFETAINASKVSLLTQAAVVVPPQSVNRGIYPATSELSATRLPQPEYSISDSNFPSVGGSTLSPTGSFEPAANPSKVSLPMRAAVVKHPQSVGSGIDQTTSRQPTTRQPQPEFPNPDTSVPSVGGSTLLLPSRESSEPLVNTSDVSLPKQVAVGKPPYSSDSGIDQTTPRQSVTHLPQLEYTNLGTSVPSLGGSTLFAASSDSFETLVNTSEVFPPAAAGKRPQSVDSGIGLQLEAPTADTLSTPPPSAPPSTLLVSLPSPSPPKDREPQSAPPIRKWEAPGNWFKRYEYDYETESWRPREA